MITLLVDQCHIEVRVRLWLTTMIPFAVWMKQTFLVGLHVFFSSAVSELRPII